ncbi:MAG: hypothetical protein J6V53_07505 [Alphaproteobacteria bacterium]|nr:hypothetical protein [Alphaproteobacteria bacterium]
MKFYSARRETNLKTNSLKEKVSDILFYKGLFLISKNYRSQVKLKIAYRKIKDASPASLSAEEVNLILGELKPKEPLQTAKIISLKKKKQFIPLTRSIKVYIHE